jgi:hypothetical protein
VILLFVMAGLVPAIHAFGSKDEDVDARDSALRAGPGMTINGIRDTRHHG